VYQKIIGTKMKTMSPRKVTETELIFHKKKLFKDSLFKGLKRGISKEHLCPTHRSVLCSTSSKRDSGPLGQSSTHT
jgi:hypothetical protein